MYKISCGKCLGTGILSWARHVKGGVCFSCDGRGFNLYKTKPTIKTKYAFGTTECFPQYWRKFATDQKAANYAAQEGKPIFMCEDEYSGRFNSIEDAVEWAASK